LKTALREDLGLSPSAEVCELERRILQHDPSLAISVRPSAPLSAAAPDADAVHAALGRARSARALARAGVVDDSLRFATCAVAAARPLDAATLAECLVVSAQVLALAGRAGEAVAALDEAVPLARRAGAAGVLATAAIVRFGFGLADGDDLLAALTEPLEQLAVDAPERVDLLCAAMHQMTLQGGVAGAARLLAQAEVVAVARPTARSKALVQAGRALLAGVRGENPADVRVAADEALCAAEAACDPTLVVAALHGIFRPALELGDLDGLDAARRRLAEVATESLFPFAVVRVGLLDVSLALARGELAGLDERLTTVEVTGSALGVVSIGGTTGAQRGLLALERGQFELVAALSAAAGDGAGWRAVQAVAIAEIGRVPEAVGLARRVLGVLGDDDAELSDDDRLIAALLAGEVAVIAGDPGLARCAASHLTGARGRFAVSAHATVTLGPVDLMLGRLALVQGDVEAAITSLRDAVALARQAPLWLARCQLALAVALRDRGADADVVEAAGLLERVSAAAEDGQAHWLRVQLDRALASISISR
jgi:hypothetical protein